jgi:hypothetical protein
MENRLFQKTKLKKAKICSRAFQNMYVKLANLSFAKKISINALKLRKHDMRHLHKKF